MKVKPYAVVYDIQQVRGPIGIWRKRGVTRWEALRYLARKKPATSDVYQVRGSFWSSHATEWRYTDWVDADKFVEDPCQFDIDNGQYK